MTTSLSIRTMLCHAVARCLEEATVTNVDDFCDEVDVGIEKSTKPILIVEMESRFQIMSYHVATDD